METVDRDRMCKLIFPQASLARQANRLSTAELHAAIAATAEGYAFPTNLDRDPPTNGLAPETQAAFFRRALAEGIQERAFTDHLDHMSQNRRA
jgi:ectoine hydroxylase-related dioxygenase (phytanoyl-CoA dioxygenase family)